MKASGDPSEHKTQFQISSLNYTGCLTVKVHLSTSTFYKRSITFQVVRITADALEKKFSHDRTVTHYETKQYGVNTQRLRDFLIDFYQQRSPNCK